MALDPTKWKRARPYPSQTNGKNECYHRAMATEWIYSRSWSPNGQRHRALQGWLHYYSYQRAYSALGGYLPISSCPEPSVNNPAA